MSSKLKRYDGSQHEGPANTSPYPVSRLAPAHDLVDLASEVQHATETLQHHTAASLRQIASQMRFLQAQARQILEESARHTELHRARASFEKHTGQIYHLYESGSGLYWSILSPAEWGTPPHPFRGSYRLEADHTFTRAEDLEQRDMEDKELFKLLS
ncbi:MAG: DUF2452 domain-containing protein [Myxococcota bacterium]